MIKVKNLTKKYGSNVALDNVSFSVKSGEIAGFLGPNGAGKTTAMNIITGYLSSTSGTVTIDGFDILDQPTEAKKRIGYLPEIPPLYPDMTVNEYLEFIYELKRATQKKESHFNEICELTGISGVRRRLIKNLSKGYRQRVGIAQTLVGNPPVLILDEPTVGLDPKQIAKQDPIALKHGENFIKLDSDEFNKHGNLDVYFDVDNFDPTLLYNNECGNLLKIDFVVKNYQNNFSGKADSIFTFDIPKKDGRKNTSLVESIKVALSNTKVKEQLNNSVIYTIYVFSERNDL